ncbi:GtrA family protein [Oenococcus oeni]|uniref:GtrA family protein n=2 Tax=Oenococcus oeni TaxID=1247 RepID=UPI000277B701|nr:GtrA family protein [Oenococcus oeni]EJO08630.1 GtcA family membrane protein [Oenococcus oeni AWRIB553]EKP89634.1 GtcA family membrane protein [Oenococcus oeni DSM 20252 = AWRIB129]KGH54226.1 membrane protein [Oenococcus oeni IOEB_S277]KGH57266.1 membrane protein [Oenococcus oeni IOEB_B10]KGH84156.1 membrane protein [Oenococcus oeni S15]
MKNFFNKNYEIILYLIFGILTTVVYFIARFLTLNLSKNALLAVAVAQILAILFAFITNKIWVFKKAEKAPLLIQFLKFVAARLFVFLLDFFITWLCIEKYGRFFINFFALNRLNYQSGITTFPIISGFIGSPTLANTFIWSMFVQIAAIILNYVFSKLFIFENKKQ